MGTLEHISAPREHEIGDEAELDLRIVPTHIESRRQDFIGRDVVEAIRRTIKPSLYDRLRKEMGITD